MEANSQTFTTAALLYASEAPLSAFHKWRSRNGLFPETVGSAGWNKFSVVEICLVRAIVILTQVHDIGAENAVYLADPKSNHVRKEFERILAGDHRSRYLGIHSIGGPTHFFHFDDTAELADVMRASKGAITIIELTAIADHVVRKLQLWQRDAAGGRELVLSRRKRSKSSGK